MTDFLIESGLRVGRLPLIGAMMAGTSAKYAADIQMMNDLVFKSAYLDPIFSLRPHVNPVFVSPRRSQDQSP